MIANRYQINSEIKRGAFGIILKGQDKKTDEPIAIKIDHGENSSIQHEVKIIQYLFMAGVRKIPSIYWFGQYSENPCIVMTYYDYSLYDYLCQSKTSGNEITKPKMDIIMIKAIDIFENIHKKFALHRDIKPQNFMVKNGDIFLIDFGLSTFYINDQGFHYPNEPADSIIGSPQFVSINIHKGSKYSRRDDIISLGYFYLFMLGNSFDIPNKDYSSDLSKISIAHPINVELQERKEIRNIPLLESNRSAKYYMKYAYNLEYEETPKYEIMKRLFI